MHALPMSVLIIGLSAAAQAIALIFARSDRTLRVIEWISAVGFFAAAVALMWAPSRAEAFTWFGLLEDQPLFRLPRAAFLLAAMLLGRAVVATGELPGRRKHEVLFLLSFLALTCDLLLLSRQFTLTVTLLVASSWLATFLGGLAFRGRSEGEALLKYWLHASLGMAIGFGAIVLLALLAGGVHYDTIATFLGQQEAYSSRALLVVFALCLPFVIGSGLFPFHLVQADRDQGLPWPVVAILDVVLQGVIALALWKMGIEIFGKARPTEISEGMRTLQLIGLSGGFWLAIVALTQDNSKRLFSALVGAQWSTILAAGAFPSSLGASAVTYAFASVFLWTAVLGYNWGRFQEQARGDRLQDVYGAARSYRASGLLLLISLASPLCVPGMPGFPAVLNLLAAIMEQKSLFFLFAEVLLVGTLSLVCIRLGTDLLFRQRTSSTSGAWNPAMSRYTALDRLGLGVAIVSLVGFGFLWHRVFELLVESAKVFLK